METKNTDLKVGDVFEWLKSKYIIQSIRPEKEGFSLDAMTKIPIKNAKATLHTINFFFLITNQPT